MKAARFHGRGDIRIDDVPDPQVGPGQVEVSVDWCGICGTDLHEFLEGPIFIPAEGSPHPLTGSEPPGVMGPEFAGVVSRVGSGVAGVRGGERVAVEPDYVGGGCGACTSGRYNVFRHPRLIRLAGPRGRVGRGVTGGREGDRVAVEPYYVCGECVACTSGRYNVCRKLGFVGLAGQQGGFAERCVVDARWVHPLGDLPTDIGALVEPLAVA